VAQKTDGRIPVCEARGVMVGVDRFSGSPTTPPAFEN
jgi:hypothetical protein